jgi:hypothetical protein
MLLRVDLVLLAYQLWVFALALGRGAPLQHRLGLDGAAIMQRPSNFR